jgi:transcriptional regulator with XRE-family HTH domain
MTEQPQPAGDIPEWTIGWRLQRALAHAGIPAGDVAVDIQVSRATVSRWLNDRGLPPRWVYIERIAELTGVPALWLCHGDLGPCGGRDEENPPEDELSFRRSGRRGANVTLTANNMQSSQTKIKAA